METNELVLFEADCSECGHRYVGSPISTRPDLCHPGFMATVTAESRPNRSKED
jgi:hypothetical protein